MKSISNNKSITLTGIILIISLAVLVQVPIDATSSHSAFALTRYFNCVTQTANSHGSLSLDDVTHCYDRVFQGAQNNDEFGHKLK